MRVLDLFSGIGGFSLGLERAGMRTVAFCECEPYARAVLARWWPGIPCYLNVRGLTAARLASDGISIDVLCGGFPCTDISPAGKRAGIGGEESGLWKEYARLIGELRPAYAIMENSADLLSRGLGVVLGDLAAVGYDAEWHCIPAAHVGAPHIRDRIWIVAYPNTDSNGQSRRSQFDLSAHESKLETSLRHDSLRLRSDVAHAYGLRFEWREQFETRGTQAELIHQWSIEPAVGRVADGVPARTHRLRCLGNAVIPEIPYRIGRAIMRAANS
jgi:DNA (cytosine-5)-methyltransferase 1